MLASQDFKALYLLPEFEVEVSLDTVYLLEIKACGKVEAEVGLVRGRKA